MQKVSKKKNKIETNAIRYCQQQTAWCCILVELVSGEKRKYLNGCKVHNVGYEHESKRNVATKNLSLKKKPEMASRQV